MLEVASGTGAAARRTAARRCARRRDLHDVRLHPRRPHDADAGAHLNRAHGASRPAGTAPAVDAAGAILRALVGVVDRVRPSPRPLHPRGVVRHGTLLVDDTDAPGARELGAPLVVPAVARVSRAAGLPAPLPDVFGVAVRWEVGGRTHDLLLSATGLGPVSRFVLVPRRRPLTGPHGTLMPFLDAGGRALLVAAVPAPGAPRDGGVDLLLLSARPGGRWQRLGRLVCPARPVDGDDPGLRFDPVLHVPGDLRVPGWAARLRLPSYRRARAG